MVSSSAVSQHLCGRATVEIHMAGPEPMLLAIMPSCLSGFGGWGNSETMGQHLHHFQQVVIWDSLAHLHCILGSSTIEGSS